MIDWIVFLPACFALNLAFGPSNLLAMTHGSTNGVAFAQCAGLARLAMFVPMIAVIALGLGFIITASALIFSGVKIIGATYLIWVGMSLWRSSKALEIGELDNRQTTLSGAVRSEALVALSNPKSILVFAAFFPQFVVLDAYWQSYVLLGTAFLIMEAIAIFAYATVGRFASKLASGNLSTIQRISGAAMVGFGILLLLSPHPARA